MWEYLTVEYRPYVQAGLFIGIAIYAYLRGEAPERFTSLTFVGAIVLDQMHHALLPGGRNYEQVESVHLLIDSLMFVALAYVAMRANRIYPLWLLAAQIISTAMHLERGIVAEMHPFAYWILTRAPSYLQMIVLIVGILAHRRRVRRGIHVKPWRQNSKRSLELPESKHQTY